MVVSAICRERLGGVGGTEGKAGEGRKEGGRKEGGNYVGREGRREGEEDG